MDTDQQMTVRLFGVRGSVPISSPETIRYGGNTSCLAVYASSGALLIVDAGTGIQMLGRQLARSGECHLLLSHAHWDHVHGLPFFDALHNPDWIVHLYVPHGAANILSVMLDGVHFPVHAHALKAQIMIREYSPGEILTIGSMRIETFAMMHPGGSCALRIHDGWTLALSNDCEISPRPAILPSLLHGADVAIVDGQYNREEYSLHAGWGHSFREAWVQPALDAGVRRLIFTHHGIDSSDDDLDRECLFLHEMYASSPLRFEMAREGLIVGSLAQNPRAAHVVSSCLTSAPD